MKTGLVGVNTVELDSCPRLWSAKIFGDGANGGNGIRGEFVLLELEFDLFEDVRGWTLFRLRPR